MWLHLTARAAAAAPFRLTGDSDLDISMWCVFAAFMLIYLPRLPAIRATLTAEGHVDIANPRLQQARLSGLAGRAQAAHLNSVEAFAPFAAAVWVAHYAGVDGTLRDGLGLIFVAARFGFIACYLADLNPWRTVVWSVGFAAVIALFVAAAVA